MVANRRDVVFSLDRFLKEANSWLRADGADVTSLGSTLQIQCAAAASLGSSLL
jgi:hypothetical protein